MALGPGTLGDLARLRDVTRRGIGASTAYWYQRGCTAPLPPLPPAAARMPRPDPPELTRAGRAST
jgi:hypothetical protein